MAQEKRYYQIAAFGYLAIFILAIFANFFVFEVVYVPEDVAQTATNIQALSYFSWGGIAFVIVAAVDIVIAWALYYLFRPRSQPISLLSSVFRILNAAMLAIAAVFFLLAPLHAEYLGVFEAMWMVALLFFGIHLILLAKLLYSQSRIQTILAGLLSLAALVYIVDTILLFTAQNYLSFANTALAVVAIPAIIGELGFTIWLWIRGFSCK